MNVIFTCGGTAGHINPAVALARMFEERYPGCKGLFMGADGGMENKLVPKEGYEIKSVTIGVNLDAQLRPREAGVLSVNPESFRSGDTLHKILRLNFKEDEYTCIAALQPFNKSNNENQQNFLYKYPTTLEAVQVLFQDIIH